MYIGNILALLFIAVLLILLFDFNSVWALVHNALQLPFFFFFFFSFSTGFWANCLELFSKRFIINYQGSVWPRSDSFLGHTKKSFRKKCSWSCYSQCVWHMARLKHGNQHSQHPKKHKLEHVYTGKSRFVYMGISMRQRANDSFQLINVIKEIPIIVFK